MNILDSIKNLYRNHMIDNKGVAVFVKKQLITAADYEAVTGEPYEG